MSSAPPGQPTTASAPGHIVDAVERRLLAHQDFGRSDLISRRVVARYDFVLDVLADRLPRVAALVPRLRADSDVWVHQVLRDPVVKTTLESAVVRLERDELGAPDDLETVFDFAAAALAAHPELMPTQAEEAGGLCAGPTGRIWVPRFDTTRGPLVARLEHAFSGEFLSHNQAAGHVVPSGAETAERVSQASDLLVELLPQVGSDVLEHIVAFGRIDAAGPKGRLLSASGGDGLPGLVALRPSCLDDPWETAGRLLHEGLHLKLFDIMRCYRMIADPAAGAQVPWRDVRWDVNRMLAAFHVYTHLVLYQQAVRDKQDQLAARFGKPAPSAAVSSSTGSQSGYDDAIARARYLGEQLSGPLAKFLTTDGQRLVRWLRQLSAPLTGEPTTSQTGTRAAASNGHDGKSRSTATTANAERYVRDQTLRLRPVPEGACLFAFRPSDRTVHFLNLSSWSVFELCQGQPREQLDVEYADLVRGKLSPSEATRLVGSGLACLVASGLIRPAGESTSAEGR